jgi:phosphodiesterase/alkaline phosphatase D-like protein
MTLFDSISAGSATANSAVFWAQPSQAISGTLVYGDAAHALRRGHRTVVSVASGSDAGNTIKTTVSGLDAGKTYAYAFKTANHQRSAVGYVKTAPAADAITGLKFGFSGCASGEYGPINSVADIAAQKLDFFMMLGDAAYEDDYSRAASDPRGALNSDDAEPPFNPNAPQTPSQTHIDAAVAGMAGKYRDMLSPRVGNLEGLYRSQGVIAAYDNHEMVDMALEAGGGARSLITVYEQWPDRAEGKRVPTFREGGNLTASNVVRNQSGSYLNQSPEHQAMVGAWMNAMPLQGANRVDAPADPRSHGTRKLYSAQQWGKQAVFVNVDTRSYRDAKITELSSKQIAKAGGGTETRTSESDVTGVEIDQAAGADQRTMLGATQLAWLKQTLLDAKNNGTTWKFVSLASPIDITGVPGTDGNFTDGEGWVDAKSWWGNYRYERNELLKFIADHSIKNVVFIATDDHEARITRLSYVPTVSKAEDLTNGALHRSLEGVYSVVASPLGAGRPYAWVKDGKTKNDIVTAANKWSSELANAGYNLIGLTASTPGFVSVRREKLGDYTANPANPQPIDFWSPDTFNYAVMDMNPSGQLNVALRGIDGLDKLTWPQNGSAASVREILSVTLNPIH